MDSTAPAAASSHGGNRRLRLRGAQKAKRSKLEDGQPSHNRESEQDDVSPLGREELDDGVDRSAYDKPGPEGAEPPPSPFPQHGFQIAQGFTLPPPSPGTFQRQRPRLPAVSRYRANPQVVTELAADIGQAIQQALEEQARHHENQLKAQHTEWQAFHENELSELKAENEKITEEHEELKGHMESACAERDMWWEDAEKFTKLLQQERIQKTLLSDLGAEESLERPNLPVSISIDFEKAYWVRSEAYDQILVRKDELEARNQELEERAAKTDASVRELEAEIKRLKNRLDEKRSE